MSGKYLVVEVKSNTNVGKIVEMLSGHTEQVAVVDEVPGIFRNPNKEDFPGLIRSRIFKSSQKELRAADHVDDRSGKIFHNTNNAFEELTKENRDVFEASILEVWIARLTEFLQELSLITPTEHYKMSENFDRFLKTKNCGEDETALSTKRKSRDTVLICGLCQSKMTLRASYGRTRLREHVMRHLNMPTAQCSHCDFQGILREHVRRHYMLKHKDIPPQVIELEPEPNYYERFDALWRICFPHTDHIQPRVTSQRARCHEARFHGRIKEQETEHIKVRQDAFIVEGDFPEKKLPVTAPIERALSDDDFYEPDESFFTVSA